MIKKLLALMVLVAGVTASACWFTTVNYDKCYIARINTAITFYSDATWTGSSIPCPPAGTQDLPCQVWVKIAPRDVESPYDAPAAIHEALLQYKKLPSGSWTTFKDLHAVAWTMDFSKPVELFGPNIFDPPGAVANDEYLVRLYFTDGIYENAALATNAPEGGDATWRNQWVTKITISGKRRPQ